MASSDREATMERDVWMVSVDDHVVEPPDVWQSRVSPKFKDAAPRVVPYEKGSAWLFEGKHHPISGMWAVAGKPPSEWTLKRSTSRICREAHTIRWLVRKTCLQTASWAR